MARGFAAGLLQGALVSGAALAILSVVLPQPGRDLSLKPAVSHLPATDPAAPPAATPDAAPPLAAAPVPPTGTDPTSAATPASQDPVAAPPPNQADLSLPAADTLVIPSDSEFVRGSDLPPVAPAPMTAPTIDPADVPAIAVPEAEAVPVVAESVALPDARRDAPAAPAEAAAVAEPPDLPAPAQEAPAAPPASSAPPAAIAAAPDQPFRLPAIAPPPPARAATGFDLSTPPDFGALRLTEPTE